MAEKIGTGMAPIIDEQGDGLLGFRDAQGRNWMMPRWSLDASGNAVGLVGPAGGVVGAKMPSVTADSQSAATANTAALQAALDAGGEICVATPGVVWISDALVIGSDTHLKLGADTTIKLLTGGTVKNMLVSAGYRRQAAGFLSCTLTWTAGRSVTINRTAHGLSVGQYVYMWSSNLAPSCFAGVFPVVSVTDANAFVVRLHRTPSTAPTGTAQYVLADTNIRVEGGTWDQNYPTNTFGSGSDNMGIIIGVAAHASVSDVTINNCAKYCLEFGAVYDYSATRIATESSSSDIIKVYGPAVGGRISKISGTTADDVLSFQGKEAAPFSAYMWTFGDVHDATAEDLVGNTANGGVATCYYSVNEYMGGITFRRIGGFGSGWCVAITAGYSNGRLDDVTIDGVRSGGTTPIKVNANGYTGGVINRIEVRDFDFEPDTYASNRQGVVQDANTTVNEWLFIGTNVNSATWPSSSTYLCTFLGVVGTATWIGGRFSGNGSNGRLAQFTGGVTTVNMQGCSFTSAWSVVFDFSTTGTPTVNLTGNDFSCFGAVVQTTLVCTVNLNGNRCNANSNGVVRANAAVAITVRGAANNWVTTNSITNGSGTGNWRIYGWDIPINLNTSGITKVVAGQFCLNTTLAGTLAAGRLAHCNGTNFLQLDTPANVF